MKVLISLISIIFLFFLVFGFNSISVDNNNNIIDYLS